LFALSDVAFALPNDRPLTLADVQMLVHENFQLMWDYRFIYREIIALLRQDEVLHQRYLTVRQRGYEGFHELIRAFTEAGVLIVSQEDGSATRLVDLCWLISEFWLPAVEVRGIDINQDQMQQGVALMMQVLEPYIPKT